MPIALTAPALAFPPLSQRFVLILEGLCRAAAASSAQPHTTLRPPRGWAVVPLLVRLWSRLRRSIARFDSLARRAAAGRLRPPATIQRLRRPPDREPRDRLPRGVGWLIKLLPEANGYGSQLRYLLSEPEMADLLQVAPQAGRILRPLCQMLAIPAPPRAPQAAPPQTGKLPTECQPENPTPPQAPIETCGARSRTRRPERQTGVLPRSIDAA